MPKIKTMVRRVIGDVNAERLKRIHARASSPMWKAGVLNVPASVLDLSASAMEYAVPGKDTFCGYYERCPQSPDGTKVLASVVNARNTSYARQGSMAVGYFHIDDGARLQPLAETEAWSWQMGCMLTWLCQDASDKIIFNRLARDRYVAAIADTSTQTIDAELSWPVYSVSDDGRHALSCSFSRLHRLRPGYGYPQLPDVGAGVGAPDDDGVWLIDVAANSRALICSLAQLAAIEPTPSMVGAQHYINHLKFGPSGDRFLFFHLWVKDGRQYSRMFTSSVDSTGLYLISNKYVSHYCWRDPETIIVYSEAPDGKTYYNEFKDFSGFTRKLFVEHHLPDGHGTYSAAGDILLTDTYPDEFGFQHLYLIRSDGALLEFGKFFHPSALHMDRRCDLHPKWSRDERSVFVDAAPDGRRRIVRIDIDRLLERLRSSPAV